VPHAGHVLSAIGFFCSHPGQIHTVPLSVASMPVTSTVIGNDGPMSLGSRAGARSAGSDVTSAGSGVASAAAMAGASGGSAASRKRS
jgi:hypothetical protein